MIFKETVSRKRRYGEGLKDGKVDGLHIISRGKLKQVFFKSLSSLTLSGELFTPKYLSRDLSNHRWGSGLIIGHVRW